MTSFHKATPEDIPLIRELCLQVWPQTYSSMLPPGQVDYMLELMYSEKSLQEQMVSGVCFFIVSVDKVPVGFASWTEMEARKFKLEKLYVLPSQQGKGTGRAFIEHIANEILQAGGTAVYLQVKKTNPARFFYEKTGYSIKEEVVLDIGNGFVMDDYIMERKLTENS